MSTTITTEVRLTVVLNPTGILQVKAVLKQFLATTHPVVNVMMGAPTVKSVISAPILKVTAIYELP